MIKYPYSATMRVNETETIDVDWLLAADDAQQFDFPTAFGSSRYNIDHLPLEGLGEIWVPHAPISYATRPGWLKGDHICGTVDQWQNGYPVGSPAPPIGPDGVPACCGSPAAAYDYGFDLGYDS